jgi:hypothetical protein
MKRRTVIFSVLAVVALLVVVVFIYAFTNVGRSENTCSPFLLGTGYTGEGPMPFKIEAIGNKTGVITGTNQFGGYSGSGTIVWCIYNNSGTLERSLQTNRIIGHVVASANGQSVAVSGFQIAPGPAGAYSNGALYLFDKSGMVKWSLATGQPIFATNINSNGSVIIAFGSELIYVDGQGKVIWNYASGAFTAALVGDGSSVVAGSGENGVGDLVMLDSRGNAIWNVSIPVGGFGSTDTVSVSNGLIAAGVANSGFNGTLLCYDLHGGLVWSRHVDSDILSVNFENNGSTIFIETNWGHVSFDRLGNVTDNQTSPH